MPPGIGEQRPAGRRLVEVVRQVNAVLSRSFRWKAWSIATAASTRLGPVNRAIRAATTSPNAPAIANGAHSGPGTTTLGANVSTAITTAVASSAAPRHQTSAPRNLWNRNRRHTRPMTVSNSRTMRLLDHAATCQGSGDARR